jgi:ABC-type dipeptide/oligopeptide/nickel transport system permease subunit
MPFVLTLRLLFAIAVYIGVGAGCYALFNGGTFDFASAMTYAWLLAWPFMLFGLVVAFVLGGCLVALVGFLLWLLGRGAVDATKRRIRANRSRESFRSA